MRKGRKSILIKECNGQAPADYIMTGVREDGEKVGLELLEGYHLESFMLESHGRKPKAETTVRFQTNTETTKHQRTGRDIM